MQIPHQDEKKMKRPHLLNTREKRLVKQFLPGIIRNDGRWQLFVVANEDNLPVIIPHHFRYFHGGVRRGVGYQSKAPLTL